MRQEEISYRIHPRGHTMFIRVKENPPLSRRDPAFDPYRAKVSRETLYTHLYKTKDSLVRQTLAKAICSPRYNRVTFHYGGTGNAAMFTLGPCGSSQEN